MPGGLVRGLFEYDYRADSLRVRPHLPSDITRYVQKKAVLFGKTKVYLTVTGTGKVVSATANGNSCRIDANGWIELKNPVKDTAVEIVCGNAKAQGAWKPGKKALLVFPNDPAFLEIPDSLQSDYHVDLKTLKVFYQKMVQAGLDETYEGAMGRTALELMLARYDRQQMRKAGTLPIPEIKPVPTCNQEAVEDLYATNALNIAGGLTDFMSNLTIWRGSKPNPTAVAIANQVKLNQESANAVIYINGKKAYELKDLPVQTMY